MLIGFEPMSLPWEGSVLAARRWHHMVGEAGLEPAKVKTDGFTVRSNCRYGTPRKRIIYLYYIYIIYYFFIKINFYKQDGNFTHSTNWVICNNYIVGFEPTTTGLQVLKSFAETIFKKYIIYIFNLHIYYNIFFL